MKAKFNLIICFIVFGLLTVNSASAQWQATITAMGEDVGGVNQYDVVIGVESSVETLPAPPAPPEYSVKMDLNTSDWQELLSRDIHQDGESSYMWIIGIDPHGNVPPPNQRTTTMNWDPSAFDFATYDCELREGFDGTGNIVIEDMEINTSYDVTGSQAIQYFTITCTINHDPSLPQIVYPVDGQTCTKTTETFIWGKSTDADGDNITYKLKVCEDDKFTIGCMPEVNIVSLNNRYIYYAGMGSGLLIFGIVLVGSTGDKKRLPHIIAMIIIAAGLFIACGSGGDDPPITTPTTTVSGTVLDGNGDPIEGAEVTISSDPVKTSTENNGNFSVDVEVGSHDLKIMMDSVEIHSETISCEEGKPLLLGEIETSYLPGCKQPNAPTPDLNSEISHEVSRLKAGTKYYWKVVADDGNRGVSESEVRSFTIK